MKWWIILFSVAVVIISVGFFLLHAAKDEGMDLKADFLIVILALMLYDKISRQIEDYIEEVNYRRKNKNSD